MVQQTFGQVFTALTRGHLCQGGRATQPLNKTNLNFGLICCYFWSVANLLKRGVPGPSRHFSGDYYEYYEWGDTVRPPDIPRDTRGLVRLFTFNNYLFTALVFTFLMINTEVISTDLPQTFLWWLIITIITGGPLSPPGQASLYLASPSYSSCLAELVLLS